MPTTRKRLKRAKRSTALSPAELEFALTGDDSGLNPFAFNDFQFIPRLLEHHGLIESEAKGRGIAVPYLIQVHRQRKSAK